MPTYFLASKKPKRASYAPTCPQTNELTIGSWPWLQRRNARPSKRTKEALAAAKARGVRLGCPNGAQHLRKYGNAAGVEIQGLTRANVIAQELNRQRIATPRGGKWYAASVSRLLQRL
ncbi:recombinase family protein [Desulfocurvibacter africanus]|uniref:recombinase family protein n=1 Tax=Desulfocurvibacter africanus TaxID=873 RepID=UPI001ED94AD6|nr:recombinase family protein [Desulfocurvibacter africanus]